MADATQTQLDYRTLNIEKLTSNLMREAQARNKNVLIVEPGSESGQNFLNIRVYRTRHWYGTRDVKTHDERVVFDMKDFDVSKVAFVRVLLHLGYKYKALMCGTLSDIEIPFIPQDGCESLLDPRIVDFGAMSKEQYSKMCALLLGGITV